MKAMFSQPNRLASFKPSASGSSSSSSASTKRRQARAETSSASWPHSTAKNSAYPSPATLAKYGFYFAPNDEFPDRTLHYLYQTDVADWKPGDDPLERLEEANPGNAWCQMWRSKQAGRLAKAKDGSERYLYPEERLMPTSKAMIQARKETFADLWPYDGKKSGKPTSTKLAQAGFIFTPNDDEPDTTTCIYCHQVLEGWEKGDDPISEHRKGGPECALFTAKLSVSEYAQDGSDDSGSGSDVDEGIDKDEDEQEREEQKEKEKEEQSEDEQEDDEDNTEVMIARKPRRVVSTYSKRSGGKAKKGRAGAVAVDADVSEAETDSGRTNPVTGTEDNDENGGKDHMDEGGAEQEEREESQPRSSATGRKPRAASIRAKAHLVEADEGDGIFPVKSIGKGRPTTAKGTRTASRTVSRSKKKAAASDDAIESQPTEKDSAEAAPSVEVELAVEPPVPRKTSTRRGRKKAAPEEQPEEAADDLPRDAETEPEQMQERTELPSAAEEAPSEAEQEADGTVIEHPPSAASEAEAEKDEEGEEEEGVRRQPKRKGRETAKAKATKKEAAAAKVTAKPKRGTTRKKKEVVELTDTEPEDPPQERSERRADPEAQLGEAGDASVIESVVEATNDADSVNEVDAQSETAEGTAPSSPPPPQPVLLGKKKVVRSKKEKAATRSEGKEGAPPPLALSTSSASRSSLSSEAIPLTDRSSSPAPLRSPLAQLQALSNLELTEHERSLTLGEWLQLKADEAAREMEVAGEQQIQDLKNRMAQGRATIERTLRGRS